MKILQINNYHFLFSGTERYYFELSDLLMKKGNKVAFFSMKDKNNLPSPWETYFLENISLKKINIGKILSILERIIYSFESKKKMRKLLDNFQPDIAHIHTIDLYISPSIISELKKRDIPIVYTLHNYQLIGPTSGSLFHNGKICEITKKHNFYKAIFHKCIRNSYLASSVYVLKQYVHTIFKLYDGIDIFIAPCLYIRDKFIEYDFDSRKILNIKYFIDNKKYKTKSAVQGNYVLYFGRLSPEKGIINLLEVMRYLPEIHLKIVGSGPLLNELLLFKKKYKLINVQFISHRDNSELISIINGCRFSVVPSIWNDVSPLSIIESFSCGKTVIGSNIGGIPETIHHNENGLLVEPGNNKDLHDQILHLWNNKKLNERLNRQALKYSRLNFDPDIHYEKIIKVYTNLIKIHQSLNKENKSQLEV